MVYSAEDGGNSLVRQFAGVLGCLRPGSEYRALPPRGPPKHLATLTEDELKALEVPLWGADLQDQQELKQYAYDRIKINVEGDLSPRDVPYPEPESMRDIHVVGIDGSNQRVERGSFYFILARAALVNFRYSLDDIRPYFEVKTRDQTGVVVVDGNVFNENLGQYGKELIADEKEKMSILPIIEKRPKLLIMAYNPKLSNNNPRSHALGWAVKLQQALELWCLQDVPRDDGQHCVCIRDGPLFSTSVTPRDNIDGLAETLRWKGQVLISCSKRVADSTLLVEALLQSDTLRRYWFPDQTITDSTLESSATDMLLLPRIVRPGQRTPLMEAIPRARTKVIEDDDQLAPLVCYYYSKIPPHTFVRWEVPKFMWEKDQDAVEEAFRVAAWQHELGHRAPLVQLFADERSQLTEERALLEKQTNSALTSKDLELPEVYQ